MNFEFRMTEKRKMILSTLKLNNAFAVVNYFPSRYDDFSPTILSLDMHQKRVVIKGIVKNKSTLVRISARWQKFHVEVDYQGQIYKAIVFNRPYLISQIQSNQPILISGKLDYYKKEVMVVELITKEVESLLLRPRYSLFEGVTTYEFQRLVYLAYQTCHEKGLFEEIIPQTFRERYRLMARGEAYKKIHFPENKEVLHQALRYLKYEELLIYSLTMQKMKALHQESHPQHKKTIVTAYLEQCYQHLPFTLTTSQRQAVGEIQQDLASEKTMYRLLQGDVGSGKTAVAMLALAMNYRAGYQGAFMAPTEILARQHYQTLKKYFSFDPNIQVVLLTSSILGKERHSLLQHIGDGSANIIVGTHALIQESVIFHRLGLAIIDEQHRFGVAQRKLLREKGEQVEILMMSATPIPRTLAISLFGDMDVSTLTGFPSQNRRVVTHVLPESESAVVDKQILQNVQQGHATFVVCPLIEEGSSRKSVNEVYTELKQQLKGKAKVGLLHGKMANHEKEAVMNDFANHRVQVLVATTVVEVGIDIKHANTIVIYGANGFGLAQLHQLRGRVGRGGQQSYCFLLTDNDDQETWNRLKYLVDHDDGFDIARFDLANRGQGDIAGVRQSGVYDFQVASIYDDLKILEVAREDAKLILQKAHQDRAYQDLVDYVETVMAKTIAIVD